MSRAVNHTAHSLKAAYRCEIIVRGAREPSEASWVENAVCIILVTSQMITGHKVTTPCKVRHDINDRFCFSKNYHLDEDIGLELDFSNGCDA